MLNKGKIKSDPITTNSFMPNKWTPVFDCVLRCKPMLLLYSIGNTTYCKVLRR